MPRYRRAGAKYFTALAVHHDNFDCWDSTHHAWNSVNHGPKKDVVGLWAEAARAEGLRFGVTEHLERSYSWFNTNKLSDKEGPKAGVPYDGNDPAFADFYFPPHEDYNMRYPLDPPAWWATQWANRIKELVDRYDPDLLYTDGGIAFGEVGRGVLAHFYNRNIERRGGLEAVYNLKSYAHHQGRAHASLRGTLDMYGYPSGDHGDFRAGVGVLDIEHGGMRGISDEPWQTDTCVGDWFYKEGVEYKSPRLVVHMLADIVSKNGYLLLNFPQRPDGSLDDAALAILDALGDWFAVNGEAIYGTRPWSRYGEGADCPTGDFAEPSESPLGDGDYRFSARGENTLYAIAMSWPGDGVWRLAALNGRRVGTVELLGHKGPLDWSQGDAGLQVTAPEQRPCDLAYSLKVGMA